MNKAAGSCASVALLLVGVLACQERQSSSSTDALAASTPVTPRPSAETEHLEKKVPETLFGITLGATYNLGDPESGHGGDIPIKRFAGSNTFLGTGIHYYFEPQRTYEVFPYVEKRTRDTDKHFKTSFRLYLLPVMPPSAKTIEDLARISRWEVATIEWSDPDYEPSDAAVKQRAYHWSRDVCAMFAADLGITPEVLEDFDKREYQCTFTTGERELTVDNITSRSVELSFTRDVFKQKDAAIQTVITKMRAQKIRPYE